MKFGKKNMERRGNKKILIKTFWIEDGTAVDQRMVKCAFAES